VLYVKAKEGMTKRLFEHAHSAAKNSISEGGMGLTSTRIPAIVDGPYGMIPDFKLADTVVLIAGESLPSLWVA